MIFSPTTKYLIEDGPKEPDIPDCEPKKGTPDSMKKGIYGMIDELVQKSALSTTAKKDAGLKSLKTLSPTRRSVAHSLSPSTPSRYRSPLSPLSIQCTLATCCVSLEIQCSNMSSDAWCPRYFKRGGAVPGDFPTLSPQHVLPCGMINSSSFLH